MAKKKAKKKNVKGGQTVMSDKQFLRDKVRQAPIVECYMTTNYGETGIADVLVARQHKGGKYSFAAFYIDTYCTGVKDTCYYLRIDEEEYRKIADDLVDVGGKKVSYEEVHNFIYGAIAFAEDAGIKPHEDFALTRYILEEDTEDIPLIDFDYGREGKYLLVANNRLEASKYLSLLEMNLDEDEYDYCIENDSEEDDDDFLSLADNPMFKTYGPDTEYTYVHPEYPTELKLENPIVGRLAESTSLALDREEIDEYLALPHDSLRRDLEHLVLYLTGLTCDEISKEQWKTLYTGVIHALVLLGEVGNEESLDVVLETLRQTQDYMDYHFGDFAEDVYVPTLYKIAANSLDKLLAFAKEEGLYTYLHYQIFPAVVMMMKQAPERRHEFIEWWREVLQFATEKIADTQWMDSTLCGLFICDLIEVEAEELLPEIKALFDTGLVDEGCCGRYSSVERDIQSISYPRDKKHPTDIYERYKAFAKWG